MEPTNTEIKVLLERHMTDSGIREERAIERTSKLSGTVDRLTSHVTELNERVRKVELEREATHGLARKALDSHDDLAIVIMRELPVLQKNDTAQNEALKLLQKNDESQSRVLDTQSKALDDIRTATAGIVEDAKDRASAGVRRDALLTSVDKYVKILTGLLILITAGGGFAWFVFKFAVHLVPQGAP